MATGATNRVIKGIGDGTQQFLAPLQILDTNGTTVLFSIDSAGAVTCASTITASGTQDANGNFTITNTAPFIAMVDSTASAKGLLVTVDANKANFSETAGAAGSLFTLDLANNRVGVATAAPTVALDVTGAAKVSSTLAVTGASTLTGNVTMSGSCIRATQKRLVSAHAKIGGTAGWVIATATNVGTMATLPQSQTASTLVLMLSGLKVGDTITAFNLAGFNTSGGNTVTVDADLRSLTAAAGSFTDASVAAMTQVSVTGNTALTVANTAKTGLSAVVAADVTYYILITATTGASCTVGLGAVTVIVTES